MLKFNRSLLLGDVKSVDVKTIESLMPLMMSIKSFDLGTYALGNMVFDNFMCGVFMSYTN